MTQEYSVNPLWELIQSYMDLPTHRYPPKPADLARETGVSDQVISKWKSKPMLPTAEQLSKFSVGTGIDFISLLTAALKGKGYLPPAKDVELVLEMPWGEMSDWLAERSGKTWVQHPDGSLRPIGSGRVSAVPDEVGGLVAADEQDQSISGEQEESETP